MKSQTKYLTDKSNRLIIKRNRKRIITYGKFSHDKNNQLTYWLNETPSWHSQYDLPAKISFKGSWKLNPNHDLEFILKATKEQRKGDTLAIKGEVISAENNSLVFEFATRDKNGLSHLQLIKLTGSWQADEFNRITFIVKKRSLPDTITFEGIWQISRNQQLEYSYEKTELKRKTKIIKTINFTGFWQINSAHRLTYILSKSSNSYFEFRGQIESPNLYPEEGVIKYRLGIGVKQGSMPQDRIVSLFGSWKIQRNLGVVFQMDYGREGVHKIEFGSDIYITKQDEIILSLVNNRKEPLGICITFTHKFLKKHGAEFLLRLKKNKEESRIEAGVSVPF